MGYVSGRALVDVIEPDFLLGATTRDMAAGDFDISSRNPRAARLRMEQIRCSIRVARPGKFTLMQASPGFLVGVISRHFDKFM